MKGIALSMVAVYHGPRNVSGLGVAAALRGLGVPFRLIAGREIAAGGLAECGGVIFPGGHSVRLTPRARAMTRRFVRAGGGFLGICAGAQFAARTGLLAARHHILRARGVFDMRVIARHPVTQGYAVAGRHAAGRPWKYANRGLVRVRYANGGFFTVSRGARVLVSFDEAGRMGAIVAGNCGRGRVVRITPHPESTPAPGESGGCDADRSQDPAALFASAVRFVARAAR
jgi:phosphoribosylformylglycinamidine (FGAM) synthase-like amidotransferase family enzyme